MHFLWLLQPRGLHAPGIPVLQLLHPLSFMSGAEIPVPYSSPCQQRIYFPPFAKYRVNSKHTHKRLSLILTIPLFLPPCQGPSIYTLPMLFSCLPPSSAAPLCFSLATPARDAVCAPFFSITYLFCLGDK